MATPGQLSAGVVDLPEEGRSKLISLLTFDELPDYKEVLERAKEIAILCVTYAFHAYPAEAEKGDISAMIGGAPYLMAPLTDYLGKECIDACFAYTKRVSEEVHQMDGSVHKVNVFKHAGFVPAYSAIW